MNAANIIDKLNDALNLQGRSFLCYVKDSANPITTEAAHKAEEALDRIISEEDQIVHEVAGLICRYKGKPEPRSYLFDVGYYNFVELDHLVPVIIDHIRGDLDNWFALAEEFREDDRYLFNRLSDMGRRKRSHLEELETLKAELAGA